ncbi:MAG: hypothetical protein V4607_11850 [Pseudomonadota bacterium]
MGKPEQLLVGLGSADAADIKAQKFSVDILDHYLTGVGESSWASWNSPRGEYIRVFTEQADSIGAVPMFTLYQMGTGSAADANLSGLTDHAFMTQYWDNVKLLFLKLGQYDSPALVNLEPDFWGYAQKRALNDDPNTVDALVSINPDCADLPDSVAGIAACQMRVARQYAPRTLLGFSVSDWGGRSSVEVAQFMKKLGADQADFVVLPSVKEDISGPEISSQVLGSARLNARSSADEGGSGSHNLKKFLDKVRFYHESMGRLPVLLWRAPLDASPVDSGDDAKKMSDIGARDFLKSPEELVAAGGVGIVFSVGEMGHADITNDDGQFRILALQYFANPAPL